MESRLLSETEGGRTLALVLGRGERLVESVKSFAEAERLRAAEFTAIGALEDVELAYFNVETKQYQEIPVSRQVELASLIGRITLPEGADPADPGSERHLHVHCVLARRDGTTVAGHLIEATVRPTCEVFIAEGTAHLARRKDPDSGLAVISIPDE